MQEKATRASVQEKFEGYEYPVHIIGRHVDITDPMKNYAVEKLDRINRFGVHILEAFITMDIQKKMQTVDFVILLNNIKIKVSGFGQDMYASVDDAIAHLESKLRRYLSRIHDHHGKKISEVDMHENIIERPISLLDEVNDQIEEENLKAMETNLAPPKIVKREKRKAKMLNLDEAVMHYELSHDPFMVYKAEEDQKLKLIYRCDDGNLGIIELENL